jgi:hypothetical protein
MKYGGFEYEAVRIHDGTAVVNGFNFIPSTGPYADV